MISWRCWCCSCFTLLGLLRRTAICRVHAPRAIMFGLRYFLFWNKPLSKVNSRSAGPGFTKFPPYGRYLIVDCRRDPPFPTARWTLPWQPILKSKLAKSDYSPLFVALTFRNGLQYRHYDFTAFICDKLAKLCVNLVNFDPVTPEFNIRKDVYPVVSFLYNKHTSQSISGSTEPIFLPHFYHW